MTHWSRFTGLLAVGGLLLGLLTFWVTASAGPQRRDAPSGSDRDYRGTALKGEPAPGFRLVDQAGRSLALSDFTGRPLILAFLDPDCTDSCPLTALHFRLASQQLGERATDVAFLAVNVNPGASVVAATEKWGMQELDNWYFLTGTEEDLQPVWDAYYVAAHAGQKPDKPDEQLHSQGVYLIDQAGRQRWFVSVPFDAGEAWQGPTLSQLLYDRLSRLLEPQTQ